MKGRQVILGPLFGRPAAALMVDGRLEDLAISAGDIAPLPPGAICRGRVDRLVKGQGGVFLRLPMGLRGYLRDRNGLREGQSLTVQISGAAEDGKAIPVTSRVLYKGRYVVVTPYAPGINVSRRIRDADLRELLIRLGAEQVDGAESPGLIFRSSCVAADRADVETELTALLSVAAGISGDAGTEVELLLDAPAPDDIAWNEWTDIEPDAVVDGDRAMTDCGVVEAVDLLMSERVALDSGAWAAIEPVRALTAIDVNTGSDHSPAAGLKANIALARDLPRQLRLRGIGGQIVIDFAPMPKRDRGTLDQVLKAAFRHDSTETVLIGWTAMGLYELSRKRDRIPLLAFSEGPGQ